MDGEIEITVVITTYNRSGMVGKAIRSALEQEQPGASYEVIVVDNNSTDKTSEEVRGRIEQGRGENLRYVFEGRQGVSYARNAGIANARGRIIAFADDDVQVSRDWVRRIKQAFDQHPDVDFLGGKILPRWESEPPGWLTRDHWWALALLDYGDDHFYVNADNPVCLPTANASFRREVFNRFGLFSPDFSGREDHEFLLRLWRAGIRGMYAPLIVVNAEVQPERMKKGYHLRWNNTTGKFNSLMRLNEIMGPDGRIVGEHPDAVTLFGSPSFIYRDLLVKSLGWAKATLLGRKAVSLRNKNSVWYLVGYISKRYEQNAAQRNHSSLSEIKAFVQALWRKKLNRNDQQQTDPDRVEMAAKNMSRAGKDTQ